MKLKMSKLSKGMACYATFIAILFLILCSSVMSANLDDIEKFSPLSEQNMTVLTREENTTIFMRPDGHWESGFRCGTLPPTEEQAEAVQRAIEDLLQNNKNLAPAIPCTLNIPVAFHIVRHNDGITGDVTNQQINDQLAVLNGAYASTSFQFVLHSIERVNNTAWSQQNTAADEVNMKQALAISPATTLNFYTGILVGVYWDMQLYHGSILKTASCMGWLYFFPRCPVAAQFHTMKVIPGPMRSGTIWASIIPSRVAAYHPVITLLILPMRLHRPSVVPRAEIHVGRPV